MTKPPAAFPRNAVPSDTLVSENKAGRGENVRKWIHLTNGESGRGLGGLPSLYWENTLGGLGGSGIIS
jgi:hypothetical protein